MANRKQMYSEGDLNNCHVYFYSLNTLVCSVITRIFTRGMTVKNISKQDNHDEKRIELLVIMKCSNSEKKSIGEKKLSGDSNLELREDLKIK